MIRQTSSKRTGRLTQVHRRANNPAIGTLHSPNYTVSEGMLRDIKSVDPKGQRIAGYYKRDHVKFSYLPGVHSTLEYVSKSDPNQWTTKSVTGYCANMPYPIQSLKTPLNWSKPLLINQVLSGIKEQCINLAMFLAELDKTAQFISNSAKKISRSQELVRGGKFKAAAKALGVKRPKGVSRSKHWSDNYLAYKFGIMPLVFDSVGAAQHLASRARMLRIRGSSRLFVNEEVTLPPQTIVHLSAGVQDEFSTIATTTSKKFSFEQVVVEYRLADGFWEEASRLGFTNAGVLTWESIPYSFVVDTFLNIGQWLGNIDLGLGLEFVTASYTQGYRTDSVIKVKGAWARPNVSLYKNFKVSNIELSPVTHQRYVLERTPLGEGDLFYTLLLSAPWTINNAITDVALVAQRLNHKR